MATIANVSKETAEVSQAVVPRRIDPREFVVLAAVVLLADLTIYRGRGYAGVAAFFFATPWLFHWASERPRGGLSFWIITFIEMLLAIKLLWSGSIVGVISGFALIVACAVSLTGLQPYVMTVIVCASQTIVSGLYRFIHYSYSLNRFGDVVTKVAWFSLLLPLAAFVVFGTIFILANPDLAESFRSQAEQILATLENWLSQFSIWEVLFVITATWITIGLMRPLLPPLANQQLELTYVESRSREETVLYPAFRNTLIVLITLFAVYLIFEFQSLWFRVFPQGFHYSGYAHRGAAWLTIALALATGTLSLIFRGGLLQDPRLPILKRLAWIWSAQNLVLAVAAFHRLYIYIGFNGLTRMRIIGMLGTATVAAGLILMIWKINHRHGFIWLVRRQLWALCAAVLIYAIVPIDAIWVRYNVGRILKGDPAPSVELSVHSIGPDGVLFLLPLVHCENQIIRDGIRAMLADFESGAEVKLQSPKRQHWTAFQISDRLILRRLQAESAAWSDLKSPENRKKARETFSKYAYQWY